MEDLSCRGLPVTAQDDPHECRLLSCHGAYERDKSHTDDCQLPLSAKLGHPARERMSHLWLIALEVEHQQPTLLNDAAEAILDLFTALVRQQAEIDDACAKR